MAGFHAPHAPEFRAGAVRLAREGGRAPRRLAGDLGCSAEAIRDGPKRADPGAGRRTGGLTGAEREGLRRSRRESRALRMERSLLRKAAACFAKGSDPAR
jgi:transposase